jgi:hypothetical protein
LHAFDHRIGKKHPGRQDQKDNRGSKFHMVWML